MAMARTWHACLVGLALAAGSGGCGDSHIPHYDLPREPVSGTVTVGGLPFPAGMIGFAPILEKTPAGSAAESSDEKPIMAASATEIRDGKYELPRDKGLVPGNYKVSISSNFDPAKKDPATGKPARAPRDVISKRYNSETELTAQVKKAEANTFNSDLSLAADIGPARSKGKTATPKASARPRASPGVVKTWACLAQSVIRSVDSCCAEPPCESAIGVVIRRVVFPSDHLARRPMHAPPAHRARIGMQAREQGHSSTKRQRVCSPMGALACASGSYAAVPGT